MAKFLPGPTVAEVRGSIGGTVYSRNRYGAYMRNRAKPVVSTTEFATSAKARMSAATQAWSGLTDTQRASWNNFAASNPVPGSLGIPVVLTGHAAFVGSYCRAVFASLTPLDVAPIVHAPEPLTTLSLTGDVGAGDVTAVFTATPLGATDRLWLQVCVTQSVGINYVQNLLKLCVPAAAATASPYVFDTELTARIGLPSVGEKLTVLASVFNNASMLLSAPLRASVVITTT